MESFIELLKEVNIAQIFIIFAGGWFFYNRLDKKMETRFEKIESRFEKVDARFQKLEERMIRFENDMIEVKTILRMKECCMITDDRQAKKAE